MKEVLFKIFVVILTPIYLILSLLKLIFKFLFDVAESMQICINEFLEQMTEFWKGVFKVEKRKENIKGYR